MKTAWDPTQDTVSEINKPIKALTAQTLPALLLHTIEKKSKVTAWVAPPVSPISETCGNLESYLVSLNFGFLIYKVQKNY